MISLLGRYDLQKFPTEWEGSAAIDNANKVVYVVRSTGSADSGGGQIYKCDYTSISPYDCTTYVSPSTVFYTSSSLTTKSSATTNFYSSFWVSSMVYGNNALYFYSRDLKNLVKCTAAETCYILADLSSLNNNDLGYLLLDNSGNILLSDKSGNAIYKIPLSADINFAANAITISSVCSSGGPTGMAFDSSFSNVYVACADSNPSSVLKCSYSSGTCSSYISTSATIAYDNTNTAVTLNFYGPIGGGMVVDVNNDAILYVSSSNNGYVLKCTAVDTCSPILSTFSISPTDDDGNSLRNPYGLKQDDQGINYILFSTLQY